MMNDGSPVCCGFRGHYPNDGGAKPGYLVGRRDFDRVSFTPGRWPSASHDSSSLQGRCAVTFSHRGCVVLLLLTSFCVNLGAVAGQTGGPLPEPGVPERIE